MSTGLDCCFTEVAPGEWYYELEQAWGSKLDPEYDVYGPFATEDEAYRHLDRNHPNPGGASIFPYGGDSVSAVRIEHLRAAAQL